MPQITQLNLRPTLAEQATAFAKENPLPPNEDAIRVKGKVENNTGFIAIERTWRNGWGATTWFAKPKRGEAAGGFDVTKRL